VLQVTRLQGDFKIQDILTSEQATVAVANHHQIKSYAPFFSPNDSKDFQGHRDRFEAFEPSHEHVTSSSVLCLQTLSTSVRGGNLVQQKSGQSGLHVILVVATRQKNFTCKRLCHHQKEGLSSFRLHHSCRIHNRRVLDVALGCL
jgi:hypothetical protein